MENIWLLVFLISFCFFCCFFFNKNILNMFLWFIVILFYFPGFLSFLKKKSNGRHPTWRLRYFPDYFLRNLHYYLPKAATNLWSENEMINIKLKLKMLIYWCTPFPIVRILLESSKFKYMSLKAIHTTRDRAIDTQSIELFKQLQILVFFFFLILRMYNGDKTD